VGDGKTKKTTNSDFEKIMPEKKIHFYKYGSIFKNIHIHLFLTQKPHCLYIFFQKKKKLNMVLNLVAISKKNINLSLQRKVLTR
jgi:hypothetical protein